jgi:hypothetical protein
MPHMAAKVTADANSKFVDFDDTGNPFWTEDRVRDVQAATTLAELGDALGLMEQNSGWLGEIEPNLPKATVKGILGAYHSAADDHEPVQIVWMHSSGFNVSVTANQGASGQSVSIVVRTPASIAD